MNPEETKKVLKWVWIVLIILAIFLAVETLKVFKDWRDINPASNSVSITGVGEVVALPDVATFSFAVSADAKTIGEAQNWATEKMNVILIGLKSLGIEDKDIKTTVYSSYPKYDYSGTVCIQTYPNYCPPGKQVLTGYVVSHTVSVKVRKVEDVGKALALAGDKGATNLSGISFVVDDLEKITDEARVQAITNAKEKAALLSKELGVRLVRVVSFYDNTGGEVTPYGAEGMGGGVVKSDTPAPTIPMGENKVIVNVTVVYEIR